MKSISIFCIIVQAVLEIHSYESPYEDKFRCNRNGKYEEPEDTILVLSPQDEYFFRKLAISAPTGKN